MRATDSLLVCTTKPAGNGKHQRRTEASMALNDLKRNNDHLMRSGAKQAIQRGA